MLADPPDLLAEPWGRVTGLTAFVRVAVVINIGVALVKVVVVVVVVM